MSIFPMIQPVAREEDEGTVLPLCKEVGWDFENNVPLFHQGQPMIVTGREAVKVWIWKAIHTIRYRHEIYSWDYGSEFESLIGQAFTQELKEAEAPRFLRECLMVNPYISAVTDITAQFEDSRLTVDARVSTIYGEVYIHESV